MSGAAADEQIIDFQEIKFMAAPLRFEHQDKCRVLIYTYFLDRVHDDGDFKFVHNYVTLRHLFLNDPGTRDEIMPAALFALPKHPEKPDGDGREADRGEPSQRRLTHAWLLTITINQAQPEQSLTDGLAAHSMHDDEISAGQSKPADCQDGEESSSIVGGDHESMRAQANFLTDVGHSTHD